MSTIGNNGHIYYTHHIGCIGHQASGIRENLSNNTDATHFPSKYYQGVEGNIPQSLTSAQISHENSQTYDCIGRLIACGIRPGQYLVPASALFNELEIGIAKLHKIELRIQCLPRTRYGNEVNLSSSIFLGCILCTFNQESNVQYLWCIKCTLLLKSTALTQYGPYQGTHSRQ